METDDRIDRLVEGELDDAERRRLLLEIDARPDGWERLALAFLEAQEWRAALAEVEETPALATTPSARRTTWKPALLAAALLLAFGGGWMLRPNRVVNIVADPPPMEKTELVHAGPVRVVGQVVWTGSQTLAQAGVPMQRIALVENPDRDGHWLASAPALVSEYSKAKLERMGCGVVERRDVIPVELADGRKLAWLVEDVRLSVKGRTPNL